MNKVKIGIIGTGSISHFHALGYGNCPEAEIYAVCDLNRERAQAFAKQYGVDSSRVFDRVEDLLAIPEIEAVSVCTWNNAHAECSIQALQAGKHVLCEKPLALNADQARKMQAVQEQTGKLLMVGFVRRFASNTEAVKSVVDAGQLGKIHYAKLNYIRRWGNPGGWFSDKQKSGGGPVIDLGVHVLDLVRYLTGKPELKSVYAATFNDLGLMPGIKGINKYYSTDYDEYNNVEDGATALLRFDNDLTVLLEVSWTRHIKQDRSSLELFGDKGGLMLDPIYEIYERRGDYLTNVKPLLDVEGVNMEEIFSGEMRHFIDCIKGRKECLCPVQDGVAIMEMLDSIYASADSGHEVVR